MKTNISVALAALVLTMTSMANHSIVAAQPVSQVSAVAEASNQFAFKLYAKLGSESHNLFFSPSSISTALGMVYAGAKGETAEQMAQTLSLDKSVAGASLHAAAGQLIRELNAGGTQGAYQLTVANRLWGQKDFKFLDSFLNLLRGKYGADLEQLNFGQPEAARATINNWVEKATNEKIKNLIPEGALGGDTRLVLTNAVYFKGTWRDPFSKDATKPMPFSLTASEKADVPMMFQKKHHNFAEIKLPDDKGIKVLQLPYNAAEGSKGLTMVLLLPNEVDGLKNLEGQLSAANVQSWIGQLKGVEVMTWLPKFQLTAAFELKPVLSSLGMPLAFDSATQTSRVWTGERIYSSRKCFTKPLWT